MFRSHVQCKSRLFHLNKKEKKIKIILSISLKNYPPYTSETKSMLKLCKIDKVSLCGSILCPCVAQTSLNFVQIPLCVCVCVCARARANLQ